MYMYTVRHLHQPAGFTVIENLHGVSGCKTWSEEYDWTEPIGWTGDDSEAEGGVGRDT